MNKLIISALLLATSTAASAMSMPGNLPPMPANCNTPQTMNIWYGEVAKRNLMAHRSPADCKAELEGLGATPGVAGRACS